MGSNTKRFALIRKRFLTRTPKSFDQNTKRIALKRKRYLNKTPKLLILKHESLPILYLYKLVNQIYMLIEWVDSIQNAKGF